MEILCGVDMTSNPDNHQPPNGASNASDDQKAQAIALLHTSNGNNQPNRPEVILIQPFSPNINSALRILVNGVKGNSVGWTHSGLSGIESLRAIDHLLVKQTVMASSVSNNYRGNKEFIIKNSVGKNIFMAIECTDYFRRNCFGGPAFDMQILDVRQREVFHLQSSISCFPFSTPIVEVKLPNGQVIGSVERDSTFVVPKFAIKNAQGEIVFRIAGPAPTTPFGGGGDNVDFHIINLRGTQVGKISKQWPGLVRSRFFTDADYFGIKFPMDLGVYMKATLLGACMLIDGIFYSK